VRDHFRCVPAPADLGFQSETAEDRLKALDAGALLVVEVEELLVRLAALAAHGPFREVVPGERHEVVVHGDLAEAFGGERRPVFFFLQHRIRQHPATTHLAGRHPARLSAGVEHRPDVRPARTPGLQASRPRERPHRVVLGQPERREAGGLDLDEFAVERVRAHPHDLAVLAGVREHVVCL
jgi:hypothetical protein